MSSTPAMRRRSDYRNGDARLAGLCCAALLTGNTILCNAQCSPPNLIRAHSGEKGNVDDTTSNVYAHDEQGNNNSADEDLSVRRNGYRNDFDTQAVRHPLSGLFSGKSKNCLGGSVQVAQMLAVMALSCIGLAVLFQSTKPIVAKERDMDEGSEAYAEEPTLNAYQSSGASEGGKTLPKSAVLKGSSSLVLLGLLNVGLTAAEKATHLWHLTTDWGKKLCLVNQLRDDWRTLLKTLAGMDDDDDDDDDDPVCIKKKNPKDPEKWTTTSSAITITRDGRNVTFESVISNCNWVSPAATLTAYP